MAAGPVHAGGGGITGPGRPILNTTGSLATAAGRVSVSGSLTRNRSTITDPNPLPPSRPEGPALSASAGGLLIWGTGIWGTDFWGIVGESTSAHVAIEPEPIRLGSRFISIPSVAPTVYNDSGSGTITLSGSGVETFSTPPREAFQANQAIAPLEGRLGSRRITIPQVPATVFNDSGAGTIVLSGSGVETFSTPPREANQANQAIEATPIRLGSRLFNVSVPSQTFNDSGAGTIVLSGSGVEAFSTPPHEPIQQATAVVAAEGRLGSRLYPQAAFAQTFNDSGSGTIVLSGSGVEQFIPPPIVGIETAPRVPYTPDRSQRSQTVGGLVATGGYALPPAPLPPFALQGKTTMGGVPQPADLNPHDPIPQAFNYYNAAPPIYNVIVPGQSNQGFKFYPVPQETISTLEAPQVIKVPASQPITYNDSGSGTIVLSGSGVESFTTPARQPVEAVQQPDLPTSFLGSRIYRQTSIFTTYNDSGSGTLVLSGSGVESFTTPPTRITTAISQPTLPVRELGSRIVPRVLRINYVDASSGTLVLSGSGFDVYVPPGGAGATPFDPNYFLIIHC